MSWMNRTYVVGVILAIWLLFPSAASAKDVAGRFALGLDNMMTASEFGVGQMGSSPNSPNSPKTGLSLKYWFNNDWGMAGVLGFFYGSGTAAEGSDETNGYEDPKGIWAFSFDLKGYYNFAKGDDANLSCFLDLNFRKESETLYRPKGPYHSDFGVALSFGLSPELFLTNNIAIAADFGLIFRFQQGFAFGFGGDNLLGGMGIHYYF